MKISLDNSSNVLRNIFIWAFFFSGGIQGILILIDNSEINSFLLGFTGLAYSGKPSFVDINTLILSMFIWGCVFFVSYYAVNFIITRFDVSFSLNELSLYFTNNEYQLFINNLKVFFILMFMPVFLGFISGMSYFCDGYIELCYYNIFAICNFLIYGSIVCKERKTRFLYQVSIVFIAILVLVYSFISVRRSTTLFLLISSFIFLYFIYNGKLNLRKIIVSLAVVTPLIMSLSVYKYYSGAINNEGSIIDYLYSSSDQNGGLLQYFIYSLLSRSNNLSALYWYFHDFKYYSGGSFVEINCSWLVLLNNIFPFLSGFLDELRKINGSGFEVYLFSQATGGSDSGGFAIPPIMEMIWNFSNIWIGFFAVIVYYIFCSSVLFLLKNKIYLIIIMSAILYPVFLNPESIVFASKIMFRGVIFSILYFSIVFNGVNFYNHTHRAKA